ncbi:MAG: hypothetical protein AAF733_09985 [Verrucomicrobiota bacterium]
MEILISDIPDDGLHKVGELPASIFELSPEDSIRPLGPVEFDVQIYAFEELLSFHGTLKGSFDLLCGTCLEYKRYDASFEHWNSDLDLEEDQTSVDLTQIIREDFLLNLPDHLRCDELVEGRICPKSDLLDEMIEAAQEGVEEQGNGAWKALDDL